MREREAGVTLTELMVSVVVAGIAVSAAFSVGIVMTGSYRDHREMVNTERAARVALEMMADAVRSASPGVRSGNVVDANGCTTIDGTNPLAAIHVRNNAGGTTFPTTSWGDVTVETGTDVLEVIHASGGVLTTVAAGFTVGGGPISVVDGSHFAPGDYVVVTDLESGVLLRVSDRPSANTLPVGSSCLETTPTFQAGSLVIRARVSRFFVATLPGEPWPSLLVDLDGDGTDLEPEPIAPGIEDLQVALGIDDGGDGDGITDDGQLAPEPSPAATDDEWYFNNPGDPVPPPIQPGQPRPLRAARVSIVARALDPQVDRPLYQRPALEDHAAGALDAYRRRVLSTVIEVRNLEGAL